VTFSKVIDRIKRIPVQRSDGKYLISARANGWLVIEDVVRKLIK
jgi:hypothetical protein